MTVDRATIRRRRAPLRMVAREIFVLALTSLLCAGSAFAQAPDGVDLLVRDLEVGLNAGDRAAFATAFDPSIPREQIDQFVTDFFFGPDAIRHVLRERDRAPLEGVPEGQGYRLVLELFSHTEGRGRVLTAGVDVRRPADGDARSWRIIGVEGISAVQGLFRLRLDTATQYAARNFEVTSEDLVLTLVDGTVFLVQSDDGITGVVLLGRGEMRFSPAPVSERGQLRIFAGSETLATPFDSVFVRLNPSDYRRRVSVTALTPQAVDTRLLRRAQETFARESPKSFSVDLQDLSRELWHLIPPVQDFMAEIQTRRFGTLTYSRSNAQAEDITLMQRDRRRTISLYPSVAKLAARGRFYSEDAVRDFDVIDYNVEAAINPERQFVQGRARLLMRIRAASLSTVYLRLAEPLVVSSVTSVEYGRLLHLRVRNQNSIVVNMPRTMPQDSDLTLVVTYAGRLPSQDLDIDALQIGSDTPLFSEFTSESNFLLSNRSSWYPQNPVPDYATATIRVTVPPGYGCVASGQPVEAGNVVTLRDLLTLPDGKAFTFRADEPLRYLALVVSRFTKVVEKTITVGAQAREGSRDVIRVAVEAQSGQQRSGRALAGPVEDILRFYTGLVADAPYSSATVAFVQSDLPGGHSPGYFVVLNDPAPANQLAWRNDPAAFDGFPEFFLAHELAHQWWGQAVGWKNYHEQWISEGFAQYFAALYAQRTRGDRVFNDMLRQFRRWAMSQSDQGPVHLGYRLGHIKNDLRVFRALVYNKGAAVLHMLRRLLGDDTFFAGLRRFYDERKFQKAGTDDVERAFEAESGVTLDRFFERWIYGTTVPRVSYRTTIMEREVTVRFEQLGDDLFDVPVTVSVTLSDGRLQEVIVPVTDRVVEHRMTTPSAARQVQINRDSAALGEFEEAR